MSLKQYAERLKYSGKSRTRDRDSVRQRRHRSTAPLKAPPLSRYGVEGEYNAMVLDLLGPRTAEGRAPQGRAMPWCRDVVRCTVYAVGQRVGASRHSTAKDNQRCLSLEDNQRCFPVPGSALAWRSVPGGPLQLLQPQVLPEDGADVRGPDDQPDRVRRAQPPIHCLFYGVEDFVCGVLGVKVFVNGAFGGFG